MQEACWKKNLEGRTLHKPSYLSTTKAVRHHLRRTLTEHWAHKVRGELPPLVHGLYCYFIPENVSCSNRTRYTGSVRLPFEADPCKSKVSCYLCLSKGLRRGSADVWTINKSSRSIELQFKLGDQLHNTLIPTHPLPLLEASAPRQHCGRHSIPPLLWVFIHILAEPAGNRLMPAKPSCAAHA